jgi:hypothetical protein
MYACLSARNILAFTGRIFIKFDIRAFFFRKSVDKIQVSLKSDKNNGFLHEDISIFLTISR